MYLLWVSVAPSPFEKENVKEMPALFGYWLWFGRWKIVLPSPPPPPVKVSFVRRRNNWPPRTVGHNLVLAPSSTKTCTCRWFNQCTYVPWNWRRPNYRRSKGQFNGPLITEYMVNTSRGLVSAKWYPCWKRDNGSDTVTKLLRCETTNVPPTLCWPSVTELIQMIPQIPHTITRWRLVRMLYSIAMEMFVLFIPAQVNQLSWIRYSKVLILNYRPNKKHAISTIKSNGHGSKV